MDNEVTAFMRAVVGAFVGHRLDYLARYPGRIVAQNGNKVDVTPDDSRIPGLQGIPLYHSVPGMSVELPEDLRANEVRVLIGFAGGDHRQPFAELWPAGTAAKIVIRTTSSLTIEAPEVKLGENALLGVARVGDPVVAGPWAGTITAGSTKVKAE